MNSEVLRSASTRVVFPAPDGAESTKRIPLRVNRLLKVLNLLADFFEFGFTSDDALGDAGIICFCTQRVQFAKNFLGDELERATDWLVTAKIMSKQSQVTLNPRELPRNI